MSEAVGASFHDTAFNGIGMAFAKFTALLRRAGARTIDGLWPAIGRLLTRFTAGECFELNYFAVAGDDAT